MYLPTCPQILHFTPCTWLCPQTSHIGSRSRFESAALGAVAICVGVSGAGGLAACIRGGNLSDHTAGARKQHAVEQAFRRAAGAWVRGASPCTARMQGLLTRADSSRSNGDDPGSDSFGDGGKVPTSKLITSGHDNYEMIFMMLMGIRTSVGKFTNVPPRDLTTADFDQKWDGDFLKQGSADTPAHANHDFRFRDFSPLVFRQIRERFGVMTEDYLLSLTSEYVLVEMFTNSKSGSFFFYSADYRFILKTCTKREAAFLMAALPQYHAHLMAHRWAPRPMHPLYRPELAARRLSPPLTVGRPRARGFDSASAPSMACDRRLPRSRRRVRLESCRYTLLCRFFGLHRVHLPGSALGRKVYFVVMGNVFPIDRPIHERYDLKGSTRGRVTTEVEKEDPNVVLKDLDWIRAGRKLHLGEDKKRRLLAQIKKDCALLERLDVIDYSMCADPRHAHAMLHVHLPMRPCCTPMLRRPCACTRLCCNAHVCAHADGGMRARVGWCEVEVGMPSSAHKPSHCPMSQAGGHPSSVGIDGSCRRARARVVALL